MNANETFFRGRRPTALRPKVGKPHPALFGFIGLSGSGKTTLLEEVIAHLCLDGFSVSAIKHAHRAFDIDKPGKDSFRMREAGCREVMLVSDQRWALMREYRNEKKPTLESLVEKMKGVDIILIEGFKASTTPQIEVHRPSLAQPPIWPENASVVAVATDEAIDCPLPLLDLNAPAAIAKFVRLTLGFADRRRAVTLKSPLAMHPLSTVVPSKI